MPFPATLPAGGTRHTENGVPFIVQSVPGGPDDRKWRRHHPLFTTESGSTEVGSSADEVADGRTSFWCRGRDDRPATQLITFTASFVPAADGDIGLFIWNTAAGAKLDFSLAAHKVRGHLNWGGGGLQVTDWGAIKNVGGSLNGRVFDTRLWLNYTHSTRKCDTSAPQRIEATMLPIDQNHTLLQWEFYQYVRDPAEVRYSATALLDGDIKHYTALGLELNPGTFRNGRLAVQWY